MDQMQATNATCQACGSALDRSVPVLGVVCRTCALQAACTPGATPAGTVTTWAEVFPQLEVEETIREEDGLSVYLARTLDESDGQRAVLQVASGPALRRAGGVAGLGARVGRLLEADLDGLLPILDSGDLVDAFFLVTKAPDLPRLPRTLLGKDEEEITLLCESAAREADHLALLARQSGLGQAFDPALCFVDEDTGRFFQTPGLLPTDPHPQLHRPATWKLGKGERLGPFVLEALVGEGGFGVVWKARQERPVERTVAVKVLKTGLHSRRLRARFEVEQQALAQLEHPHIARFLDGGTTPDDRPYFAMEWIEGTSLTQACDRKHAPLKERLRLFRQVCDAVHHAHQKGIIHRDLKASNVMVTEQGGAAEVRVIDFGIARGIEDPLTDGTLLTRAEELVGTPAAMSPEQAAGAGGADLDARTDVYGLGVLLYELLSGQLPFDPKLPGDELRRRIREEDPSRPSTRLVGPERKKTVQGDLDWITMRCLEKDPDRRYRSVNALLRDLERHEKDEPVEAGPPELAYRMRKFVRRNKVGVGAALLVALALCTGLVVSMLGLSRAREEARRAEDAERKTEASLTDARALNGFSKAELGEPAEAALWFAYAAREAKDPVRAEQNKRRFLESLRGVSMPIATVYHGFSDPGSCFAQDLDFSPREDLLRAMAFRMPLTDPLRTVKLLALRDLPGIETLCQETYLAADFHPREAIVALVDELGVLKVVNYESQEVMVSQPLFETAVTALAFSHDGGLLAVAGVPRAGAEEFAMAVLRSDLPDGPVEWLPLAGHAGQSEMRPYPAYLRWSPDDRFLVAGIGADAVRSHSVDPVTLSVQPSHERALPARSLAVESLTRQLVQAVFPGEGTSILLNTNPVIEWSLHDGREVRRYPSPHGNPVRVLDTVPDLTSAAGSEEVLVGQGINLLTYDREAEAPPRSIEENKYFIGLDPTPDGAYLFTIAHDQGIKRWSRLSAEPEAVQISAHESVRMKDVCYSASADLLAFARADGVIKVWRRPVAKTDPDHYFPTAWADSGSLLADGINSRWDRKWRRTGAKHFNEGSAWASVQAVVNCDGTVMVPVPFYNVRNAARATSSWALSDAKLFHVGFEGDGLLSTGAFSPTDPFLLVTGHSRANSGHLAFWDVRTGRETAQRIELPGEPAGLAFDSDGQRIAVICADGEVLLISSLNRSPRVRELQGFLRDHNRWEPVNHGRITFSPDGNNILAWGITDSLWCWDGRTGELRWTVSTEPDGTAEGRRICHWIEIAEQGLIATGGGGGTIRWWKLEDGSAASLPLLRHPDGVSEFLLLPDGRRLVSVCRDGIARVWDIQLGRVLSTCEDVGGFDLALTSDGNIVSGSEEDGIKVWDPDTGQVLSTHLSAAPLRSIEVVNVEGRDLVLGGVNHGGVYGYDLSRWRDYDGLDGDECLWLAELIASKEVTSAGTTTGLDREDWAGRMASLTKDQKEFLRNAFTRDRVAWHRWMSDLPEQKLVRDWHREQLRKLEPEVAMQLDRVEELGMAAAIRAQKLEAQRREVEAALAAAEGGEWAKAAEIFDRLVAAGNDTLETDALFPAYPMVLAKLGNRQRYFEVSGTYVERFGNSEDLYQLRMGSRLYCGLPGGPDPELAKQAREMARGAVEGAEEGSSDYFSGALALGLVELRIGEAEDAARWLEMAAGAPEDLVFSRIPAWAYAAIVAEGAGNHGEAVDLLRKAEEGAAGLMEKSSWMGLAWVTMAIEEAREVLKVR